MGTRPKDARTSASWLAGGAEPVAVSLIPDKTSEKASGPRILAVAPASPADSELARAGAERLRELGCVVEFAPPRHDAGDHPRSWLAGSDAVRRHELAAALAAPCEAVWMVRGGFGSARLLGAEGTPLPTKPRAPLVAFSDGTALLAWASRVGRPSWSGPPLTQLPRLDTGSTERLGAFVRGLAGGLNPRPEPFEALTTLRAGEAEGPLFPANLCVLTSLSGTPLAPDLRGAVLALEDTGEAPYRVDRMLTQLAQAGLLDGVRGLVLGDFTTGNPDAAALRDGLAAVFHHFVVDWAGPRGVPVAAGLPFGHGMANAPLPCGRATGFVAQLAVDAQLARLSFREVG
jgi:muramoyltetrapeptide carboxypeptidase